MTISLISVILMTAGALLLEAFPFAELMKGSAENDWFPATHDPSRRHHLHVFCRTDYDEHFFLGTEDYGGKPSLSADMIIEQHATLAKNMQGIEGQINSLGRRIDEMGNHINTTLEMLALRYDDRRAT